MEAIRVRVQLAIAALLGRTEIIQHTMLLKGA